MKHLCWSYNDFARAQEDSKFSKEMQYSAQNHIIHAIHKNKNIKQDSWSASIMLWEKRSACTTLLDNKLEHSCCGFGSLFTVPRQNTWVLKDLFYPESSLFCPDIITLIPYQSFGHLKELRNIMLPESSLLTSSMLFRRLSKEIYYLLSCFEDEVFHKVPSPKRAIPLKGSTEYSYQTERLQICSLWVYSASTMQQFSTQYDPYRFLQSQDFCFQNALHCSDLVWTDRDRHILFFSEWHSHEGRVYIQTEMCCMFVMQSGNTFLLILKMGRQWIGI